MSGSSWKSWTFILKKKSLFGILFLHIATVFGGGGGVGGGDDDEISMTMMTVQLFIIYIKI